MQPKRPGWEGTILAFFMTLTVLMGVAYTLGIVYRVTIPLVAIVGAAALVAAWVRLRRQRPPHP